MIAFGNKTVLVTGAGGFIGSHLCRQLIIDGATIHGVSRKHHHNQAPDIKWWRGDLADLSFTQELVNTVKPEIIFHLASHVVGHRQLQAVQPTFHANLHSAVNLLTVASEIGCERIILVGSQEEPDVDQLSQAVPASPYAAAKWAASAYARMCHALYQTPVTIARLFMVYGPGQKDTKKLIPYTILSIHDGIAPRLTSGERPVDWIHVQDVVDGLLMMAKAEGLDGRTVDLGSGSLVTVRSIVETLAGMMNNGVQPQFGRVTERPMEQVRKANQQQTYELIGWRPRIALKKGLMETIQWYREHTEPYRR